MKHRSPREKKHSRIRLIIQALFAALSNGYLLGFIEKKIYSGPVKQFCHPSMNCYSCPGALLACPIGSLQNALSTKDFRAVLYVAGILTVIGTVCGRFVCGFLCPFGLIQDLIYKIPFFKKFRRLPGEKYLRFLRYVFLGLFVIIFPFFITTNGVGSPWFCKYVCPVGTLEGGIVLVLLNNALLSLTGFIYKWKIAILIVILIGSLLVYRPFCRYICPLGALYGLFNKFSLIKYTISSSECTSCKKCQKTCQMDIPVYEKPNSIDCIRCGDCISACPTGAIKPHFLLDMAKKKK